MGKVRDDNGDLTDLTINSDTKSHFQKDTWIFVYYSIKTDNPGLIYGYSLTDSSGSVYE